MAHEILIIIDGRVIPEVYGVPSDITIRVKDYDLDRRGHGGRLWSSFSVRLLATFSFGEGRF